MSSSALESSSSAVPQSPDVARTSPYAVRQTPKKLLPRQRSDQACSARHHWSARAKSPTLAQTETVWHSAQPGATM